MEIKILIAEDENSVRDNLSHFIQQIGKPYQFIGGAINGEEALRLAQVQKPHIVITDIRMPRMDGFELIKEMKKVNADTKFIILSGYDEFEYARTAIHLGVQEYLLKPVQSEDLTKALLKISSSIYKGSEVLQLMVNQEKWDFELTKLESKLFDALEIGNIESVHKALNDLFNGFLTKVGSDPFRLIPFIVDTLRSLRKRLASVDTAQEYFDQEAKNYISTLGPQLPLDEIKEELKNFIDFCTSVLKDCRKQSCPDVLYHCKDIIHRSYNQNITLSRVANTVGIHPSYLSRVFKKEYGLNFTDYVNNIRISKAKSLLEQPHLKIHEIAEQVGFNNAEYFTRVFKKNTGFSPLHFRMQRTERYEETF